MELGNTDLKKMELHDEIRIRSGLYVIRVSGGWIYETINAKLKSISTTFVPDNSLNALEQNIVSEQRFSRLVKNGINDHGQG